METQREMATTNPLHWTAYRLRGQYLRVTGEGMELIADAQERRAVWLASDDQRRDEMLAAMDSFALDLLNLGPNDADVQATGLAYNDPDLYVHLFGDIVATMMERIGRVRAKLAMIPFPSVSLDVAEDS